MHVSTYLSAENSATSGPVSAHYSFFFFFFPLLMELLNLYDQ